MNNPTNSSPTEISADDKLLERIGKLTKLLHNSICDLGYDKDKKLQEANEQIADIHERLNYVLSKTQSAAETTLSAIENIKPIQSNLSSSAIILTQEWQELIKLENSCHSNKNVAKFSNLFIRTVSYLENIPKQAEVTNDYLVTVIMAQDFQDLTGQVIKKISHLLLLIENELIQVLLDNSISTDPTTVNNKSSPNNLLNGPTINPKKKPEVLSNQTDVDNFLADLGY